MLKFIKWRAWVSIFSGGGNSSANEDIHHQTNRKLIHIQIELENDRLVL